MSAKAEVVFEGHDAKLSAAFERIGHYLDEAKERFEKLKVIGEGVLAALAAEAIFEKIKQGFEGVVKAMEVGRALNILSQNTGIAVADLQILEQAFVGIGKTAEDVGPTMAKMSKTIVSGSANDILEKMGVNLEELKAAAPLEQFESLGKAINHLENPTERAASAIAIFGKTGASLLALFQGKGLEEAAVHVGNQAKILGEDAALFGEVAHELSLAGLKVQGFFVGVADRIAPVLKPLLDRFATMDFSSWGQQIGDAIAAATQAFTDGSFTELLGTSLELAFLKAVNAWIEASIKGVQMIADAMNTRTAKFGENVNKHGVGFAVGFAAADVVHGAKTAIADPLAAERGEAFDTTALQTKLAEQMGKLLEHANANRAAVLKETPTIPGRNGDISSLSEGKAFAPNVSALTRVGGNFGGGGFTSDPLLTESQRHTALLQKLIEQGSRTGKYPTVLTGTVPTYAD